MVKVAAVVMASGFSKRFGKANKLLMPYSGQTIIESVVNTLKQVSEIDTICVVTQYDEIRRIFHEDDSLMVVMNDQAAKGQSESIRIGVKAVDADGYMFVPADQVNLSVETVRALIDAFEGALDKIVVPSYRGQIGSPKIFSARFSRDLLGLSGDSGGRSLLTSYKNDVIKIHRDDDSENIDIDTYGDYRDILEEAK